MERVPIAAGTFYPANSKQLKTFLAGLFQEIVQQYDRKQTIAVIVPHAGYVYSGKVAAAGIAQVDPEKSYQHIFLIGSSHTHLFKGASIYTLGNYVTPLGSVNVDPLAKDLVIRYPLFNENPEFHEHEHALEVIVPFLQFWLKKNFSIVPIVVGGESNETPNQLAEILNPYFNENNLFIISSDFSHYPSYSDAIFSDNAIAEAIISGSPEQFLKTKIKLETQHIPQLLTSACGWTAILTLLYLINRNPQYSISKVLYQNSGDSPYGSKNKVVGYHAIAVYLNSENKSSARMTEFEEIQLDSSDKKNLLLIARNTLKEYVKTHRKFEIPLSLITPNLEKKIGAFVSLHKKGKLRGCIGTFHPRTPLYTTIRDLTISSAAFDHRFDPVTPDETDDIDIEISIILPLRKVENIEDIEIGKDGICIKKGIHTGTLLPQVATQMNWNIEEFLGHCARDKAHIGWDGWRDAEIYAFRTLVFGEKDMDNL